MTVPNFFACFLVEKDAAGNVQPRHGAAARTADLPAGDVLVRVRVLVAEL